MPGTLPEDRRPAPALRPWLALTGTLGLALALYGTFGTRPATSTLDEMPDRIPRIVLEEQPDEPEARPEPLPAPTPAAADVRAKSRLLAKRIGTSGEDSTADLWSDEDIGLGDIDHPLTVSNASTSTFSIDVDTASWTRAEGTLARGSWPRTVRVEEFINAFDYDYDRPTDGHAFAVHALAAPSPWDPDTTLLRIGLQAERVDDADRKPAHLTFLVDTSGSMRAPDRLPLVVRSLHTLVDHLGPDDSVAIVTYAGASRVVLEPTSEPHRIHRALDTLAAGGGTGMADGVFTAYALAERSFVGGHINRVVLASDGDANIGPSDPAGITPTLQRYAKRGITLSSLGFGLQGNDHMMERLANDGDGVYTFIGDAREADRVLGTELTSTLQVVARDVKIQVAFDPEAVASFALVGYENRRLRQEDFADDAVDAGEVGAGHQVTAIYALTLTDRRADLGEVRLRYKPPGPDAPSREVVAVVGRPLTASLDQAPASFRKAVAIAWLARIMRRDEGFPVADLDRVQALARGSLHDDPMGPRLLAAIRELDGLSAPLDASLGLSLRP